MSMITMKDGTQIYYKEYGNLCRRPAGIPEGLKSPSLRQPAKVATKAGKLKK